MIVLPSTVVAVELHALGIGFIFGNGFFAIQAAHADVEQIRDRILCRIFAHQRLDGLDPRVMVFFFGKLREKLDEGALDFAEEFILRFFGCAAGAEGEQADDAENDGKKFLHF